MSDQREGGIAWTDETWNPVRGCSRVSPGCENCYAETVAARFSGPGLPYEGLARRSKGGEPRWTGEVRMVPEHLADPLRWKRPRRIFVNSMSDLFHEKLTNEEIAAVFGVMAAAPQHTFQVLTKRAERMRDWFEWAEDQGRELLHQVNGPPPGGSPVPSACAIMANLRGPLEIIAGDAWRAAMKVAWPLPNVWLGVSAEDQQRADERIPLLLETPAAVRFVSAEPLLGPIDGERFIRPRHLVDGYREVQRRYPGGGPVPAHLASPGVDWVIVGGESGHGARHFDVTWARSIVTQCQAAGVPVFVKQLGAFAIDSSLVDVWANGEHHYARPPGDEVITQARSLPHYSVTAHQLSRLLRSKKGGDPAEWPEDLRVREFPR
jgi:protein gp37